MPLKPVQPRTKKLKKQTPNTVDALKFIYVIYYKWSNIFLTF